MGIGWFINLSVSWIASGFRRTSRSAVKRLGAIVLGLIASAGVAHAQSGSTPSTGQDWQFEAAFYLFATGIEGDAGIRNVDSEIDVSFSDILDNLDIGGMGFLAGRNEDWSFVVDGAYLKLSAEESASRSRTILNLTVNLEVELEQVVVGVYLGRKVFGGTFDGHSYRVDLLGGARYNSISGELDFRASLLGVTVAANRERSVDWVDPVVGFRGEIWPTETVRLLGWFDYGGFGIGADSTWQMFAGASYHPTPRIDLIAGYRVLAFDYEEGSGNSRIKLDLTYSGPMIGIAYKF